MARFRGARLGARFKGVKNQRTVARAYSQTLRAAPSLGRNPRSIKAILKSLGVKY